MSEGIAGAFATLVGLFIITQIVAAMLCYGWSAIATLLFGLFVLGAVVNAING